MEDAFARPRFREAGGFCDTSSKRAWSASRPAELCTLAAEDFALVFAVDDDFCACSVVDDIATCSSNAPNASRPTPLWKLAAATDAAPSLSSVMALSAVAREGGGAKVETPSSWGRPTGTVTVGKIDPISAMLSCSSKPSTALSRLRLRGMEAPSGRSNSYDSFASTSSNSF